MWSRYSVCVCNKVTSWTTFVHFIMNRNLTWDLSFRVCTKWHYNSDLTEVNHFGLFSLIFLICCFCTYRQHTREIRQGFIFLVVVFKQGVDGIDPESVHSLLYPERQHILKWRIISRPPSQPPTILCKSEFVSMSTSPSKFKGLFTLAVLLKRPVFCLKLCQWWRAKKWTEWVPFCK